MNNEPKQTETENSEPQAQEVDNKQPAPEVEENNPKKQEVAEDDQIDYQALYNEEMERRKRAEKAIEKSKKKAKTEEEDSYLEEPDDIEDRISNVLDQKLSSFRQDMMTNTVEDVLDSMSSNDAEKKLIRFHYDNTINKTGYTKGDILNDMQIAKAIANRKKIEKDQKEARLSKQNSESYSNNSQGSNLSKATPQEDVKLSAQEEQIFQRFNFRRQNAGKKPVSRSEFLKGVNN